MLPGMRKTPKILADGFSLTAVCEPAYSIQNWRYPAIKPHSFANAQKCLQPARKITFGIYGNGRSERIRTSDPLLPKQVRYQAALRSDTVSVIDE